MKLLYKKFIQKNDLELFINSIGEYTSKVIRDCGDIIIENEKSNVTIYVYKFGSGFDIQCLKR